MSEKENRQWYCLKAKPKREHFAASILKSRAGLDVFCPRITMTRKTRCGHKAFTEALFPGYLFCLFDYSAHSRLVIHSQDVIGPVKFGEQIPIVPSETIAELRKALPSESTELKPPRIEEGDLVEILRGCFKGESGEVTKVDRVFHRVHLLIEFLGNHVQIRLPADSIINTKPVNPGVSLGLQVSTKP